MDIEWIKPMKWCPMCGCAKDRERGFYKRANGKPVGYCKLCWHDLYSLGRRARELDAYDEHVNRSVVARRDRMICHICKRKIGGVFHLDHVIPLARGGRHNYGNVKIAHPSCNVRKWAHQNS